MNLFVPGHVAVPVLRTPLRMFVKSTAMFAVAVRESS